MNHRQFFLSIGLVVVVGLSAQTTPQHIRTPYLPDWGQVPNEALDRNALAYPGTFFLEGPETSKAVALTFDDGPGPQTAELLDMLKAKGVKATFFVLGQMAHGHPDLVKRAFADGHTIGNHTWTHPYLNKLPDGSSEWNLQLGKTEDQIEKIIGTKPRFFRPPYGFILDSQIVDLRSKGMQAIAWSVASDDWYHTYKLDEAGAVDATVNQVMTYVHPGAIILMHDGGGKTRKPSILAAARIIGQLRAQGYTFKTVDELLGTTPYL